MLMAVSGILFVFTAGVLWEDIMKNFPEALGNENPNNQKIEKLFGNQGDH